MGEIVTEAQSPGAGLPEPENTEQREQLLEGARSAVREERRDRREMSELQRRIEQSLADETVTLPVGSEDVEFDTFERETSEWAAMLQERLRRLDGEDYEAEFRAEVDRIYRTLEEHSVPDWMDRRWWEHHISVRRAIQYLTSINAEVDITEEDIKNSPSQTADSGSTR